MDDSRRTKRKERGRKRGEREEGFQREGNIRQVVRNLGEEGRKESEGKETNERKKKYLKGMDLKDRFSERE